jgi:two-component system, NarL family, sensor kinase
MDSSLDTSRAVPGAHGVPAGPRSGRTARVVALGLVCLVVALEVLTVWTQRAKLPQDIGLFVLIAYEALSAAVVGLLIVRVHPRHVVGWLLLAHGVFVGTVLIGDSAPKSATSIVITQLGMGSWILLYVCLALIGYLFPDGRFLSRRWRRFVLACLAAHALFLVSSTFDVSSFREQYPNVEPQISGAQPFADIGGIIGFLSVPVLLIGAAVCARSRLRQATGEERVQMLWFAWAALAIPGGLAACWADYWLTGGNGWLTLVGVTVTGSVLPLAIGIGILRHRLFDIELVLSRTLTYGGLTVLVIATYAAVLAGLGSVVNDRGAVGLVAVGIVAVIIQPVHARLRRRVDRWVYGDRSDPYAALRRLSDRLAESLSPAQVIEIVTSSIAEALRVERVVVELDRDAAARPAANGSTEDDGKTTGEVRVPLAYQGERFGDLVVVLPAGFVLGVADHQLLDDLARQAAVIVNAVHLTLDLQNSRARLVTAQEEERRRLRRDLHDGLGPTLAAIVLKLNAVGGLVDEPVATALLTQLRQETRAAIADIRRLVDDLRPPALDEVGLVAALQQKAASLSRHADGQVADAIVIDVAGPAHTQALPAAVEVAAYRIATEALTNVVRHSGAARASVDVSVNGALVISVADNGTRPWDPTRVGVGLSSMRERAEELGGSCTVTPRPEGGTVVRAVLPLPGLPITPAPRAANDRSAHPIGQP